MSISGSTLTIDGNVRVLTQDVLGGARAHEKVSGAQVLARLVVVDSHAENVEVLEELLKSNPCPLELTAGLADRNDAPPGPKSVQSPAGRRYSA